MVDSEAPDWDPDDVSIIKEEWTPGVLDLLKETSEFSEYKAKRKFRFVHLFSGPRDVLKTALLEEAKREGLVLEVESYDREGEGRHNLAADSPYDEILASSDTIDGYHSGFPCGSFSMVRNREGGPPPVRSRLEPYGLTTNDRRQQAEADRGAVLAVRSTIIGAEVLDCQRRKKLGEVATLENPPGSESGVDLPAWLLPEVKAFMQKCQTTSAKFNTCRFQTGKQRWFKPARWEGRLQGLGSLSGKCNCPSWVSHDVLLGKDRTSKAAEYPAALAAQYAKLVVKVFKQNLALSGAYEESHREQDAGELDQSKGVEDTPSGPGQESHSGDQACVDCWRPRERFHATAQREGERVLPGWHAQSRDGGGETLQGETGGR